ncbi:MAG TPA: type II toxin-antitoxin system RelE/ParE family toxin [Armatimonadaceae bacterium]|nr:type II toxin-antitoxin system RelE/ParE family toxin [Armatimonadaceae bacterium]
MSGEDEEGELPVVYAVRLMPRAEREVYGIAAELKDASGDDIAAAWYLGIGASITSLSRHPRRFAVQEAESRRLGVETRRMLYRRQGSSGGGHHLYYTVEEGEDGPVVLVFHVRHAARRPITPAEGRVMREEI